MSNTAKIGFYGGKFFPMHKGHLYCIDTAAKECDKVIVIIFVNGEDELVHKNEIDETLNIKNRIEQLKRVCALYENVEWHIIDCNQCKNPDGSENWDMETPLVRQFVPQMDFVYSSEPSYDMYFQRAYPEATHRIVDERRVQIPISSTLIRAMKTMKEKSKWMV